MVNLSTFYNLNIYNTEGKYIGKVNEVVLNIKKGRISFFKTKALTEDNRNAGLRDVIRNSMRLVPEEEEFSTVRTEGIIDIPYEIVTAVGDIIIVDQNKLLQYQAAQQRMDKANNNRKQTYKKEVPKAN
ncbi:PRC-barrel domain-containing protein [Methanosphaera sp. Vir-13MRS]|uniref:PRC-barrel domain-containing protein n=1 Tax=Candidatus Methanosphaera massiliense TaxID=3017187 RepID=UPI00238087B1|nr:PRC-barrel domain-containing protein [Candidatus Methanosphaera massiliense]MDE4077538.1 PRC-barrel domain-containing protein [Candidatus Methanosphaera massiliense]